LNLGDLKMATAMVREIPSLSPGDHLSREEFLRIWEMHPEIKKAELIGGVDYMPSPLTSTHGDMDGDLGIVLGTYKLATPGTAMGHNSTTFLLEDSPQPDINLRILPEYGGDSWANEHNYLEGTPELLAEVCRSSASYDLHVKFDLYQAAKVPEYLAVLLYEKLIRWHVLERGKYRLLKPSPDGVYRSRIFPGLWLDAKALLDGNLKKVLKKLQDGLDSPEHKKFVEKLAAKKK
jgi:hypothetical protein